MNSVSDVARRSCCLCSGAAVATDPGLLLAGSVPWLSSRTLLPTASGSSADGNTLNGWGRVITHELGILTSMNHDYT